MDYYYQYYYYYYLDMPFGQVPVLEVDGKVLAQSITIARYLAREHGLAGETSWDQAIADQYVDNLSDLAAGVHVASGMVWRDERAGDSHRR